jgi:hypothetical protein
MPPVIFLDRGFLFAFVSEEDGAHSRVDAVLEEYRGRTLSEIILTTNHVVAETITLCRNKGHRDPKMRHERAVRVGHQLHSGAFGRTITRPPKKKPKPSPSSSSTPTSTTASWTASASSSCALGINEAWAVDSDFTHHGFVVRPGPRTP